MEVYSCTPWNKSTFSLWATAAELKKFLKSGANIEVWDKVKDRDIFRVLDAARRE